ncbi:MAG TPA: lipopolysaccharide core heptose(I) kinase RfaP [Methylophilaceae bacterium]|jgi:heptose I phosphotransferase
MFNCPPEVIPDYIARQLPAGDAFEQIMALKGTVYRDMLGRRTIQVSLGDESYFVKQHFGVGWAEIFKNLLMLRLPIISAATEWRAIHRLNELGIPTTPGVAYACRGHNPARMQSFVMTKDLGDIISLETLCAGWKSNPPDANFKRQLILAVARMARTFHDNGMNHRDFYLCHFCLDKPRLAKGEIYLYLIDLHRVGIRRQIKPAARIKDIAGLYFSAMDAGLSKKDILRFIRTYRGGLREALLMESNFLQAVDARARKLYEKIHQRAAVTPFDIND